MDWQRFIPGYWYQNGPTCLTWDAVVNKALDQFGIQSVETHTCRVGPLTVWIENWPYAYGKSYGSGYPNTGLPKVATRKKIRAAVRAAMLANVDAWNPPLKQSKGRSAPV